VDDLVELLDLEYRVVFGVQDLDVEPGLSSRRPRILGLHSLELLALVQEAEHDLRPAARWLSRRTTGGRAERRLGDRRAHAEVVRKTASHLNIIAKTQELVGGEVLK
jgi:hypothetical protein